MPEQLAPHIERQVREVIAILDELEPLLVEDADPTSIEWWIRAEQILGRASDGARTVARMLAAEDAGRG